MSSFVTNTTKLGRAIRGRMALFEAVAEVTKPISRKGEKLLELIKEKASLLEKSSLGQNLKVAKEYARVEMSPPTLSEIPRIKKDIASLKNLLLSKCPPSGKGSAAAKDLTKSAKALTENAKGLTKGAGGLTVKEALLNFLVGLEVLLWFFLGETIGKRHIVGYEV